MHKMQKMHTLLKKAFDSVTSTHCSNNIDWLYLDKIKEAAKIIQSDYI